MFILATAHYFGILAKIDIREHRLASFIGSSFSKVIVEASKGARSSRFQHTSGPPAASFHIHAGIHISVSLLTSEIGTGSIRVTMCDKNRSLTQSNMRKVPATSQSIPCLLRLSPHYPNIRSTVSFPLVRIATEAELRMLCRKSPQL